MSNPTTEQQDAADELAKEIISRFCESANKFMKDRVRLPFTMRPMQGLQLPYKPLAAKIREVAAKLVQAPVVEEKVANFWFEESPVVENLSDAVITADTIVAKLDGRKLRLGELSKLLGAETDVVAAIINRSGSGLSMSGPAKWVQRA